MNCFSHSGQEIGRVRHKRINIEEATGTIRSLRRKLHELTEKICVAKIELDIIYVRPDRLI